MLPAIIDISHMASQDKPYSSEFKAKIARKALDQDKKNLDHLSQKYDVPVSLILTWATQYEKNPESLKTTDTPPDKGNEEDEDTVVSVEIADSEISESIGHGVMSDKLDIKKLTFWSVLGIIFVAVFVQLLVEMYQIAAQQNKERVLAQSEYSEVSKQYQKDREKLSSFGVVDIEQGIYRIPIDSAINDMAVDGE